MPKVSVIVPVYNVEQYIERCARSLFEQTLDDVEFIFVDDCTPDRSVECLKRVVEDYPSRKEQVYFYKTDINSGLPIVRKIGIMHASGEYINHCDSDDWQDPEMLEKMYETAKKENADLAICDLYRETGDTKTVLSDCCYCSDKDSYFRGVLSGNAYHFLHRILTRRDLATRREIRYANFNSAEDFVLMLQYIYYSTKMAYVPVPLYHYRNNPESITGKMSKESILSRCNQVHGNVQILLDFLHDNALENKYNDEIILLKYSVREILKPVLKEKDCHQKWFSIFPEIDKDIFKASKIPLKKKVSYLLSKTGLEPYYRPVYNLLFKQR